MKTSGPLLCLIVALLPFAGRTQALDPKLLQTPLADSWPTYNGDYSGRRFSALDKLNQSNIGSLSPAWEFRASAGFRPQGGPPILKSTPIELNGVLYVTSPDHVL